MANNSLCKTSVLRIYQDVIEDVIMNVRDHFLEDGVDEQILQELKHTWETKLVESKAVQQEQAEEKIKKPNEVNSNNGFPRQVVSQNASSTQPQQQIGQVVDSRMVPIQITLPPQIGTEGTNRVLTIQVPAAALHQNQLQRVLTGPVITATMGLPANIASSVLQQHVNAAFNSQQQAVSVVQQPNVAQTDGAADDVVFNRPSPSCSRSGPSRSNANTSGSTKSKKTAIVPPKIKQFDGPMDSSDEEEEASDEDNDDDDDLDEEKDEDNDMEDEGGEEEPLNSEDDVTDDDPTDLFDTDNIVVCQYDKIIRNRNKWKFYLKDGIMNLAGQDYVFQKANGDAEW